jgi:hypothetical protein
MYIANIGLNNLQLDSVDDTKYKQLYAREEQDMAVACQQQSQQEQEEEQEQEDTTEVADINMQLDQRQVRHGAMMNQQQ